MLNRDEALELIDRLPYIRTFQAPNEKTLEELFQDALAKEDCVEWIRIIKTCYIRQKDQSKKRRPLTDKEKEAGIKALSRFQEEIAAAVGVPVSGVDAFIQRYLSENMDN